MRNKSSNGGWRPTAVISLSRLYNCLIARDGRTDMRPRGLAAASPCHPSGGKVLTAVTTFCGETRNKGRIVRDSRSDPYEYCTYLPCLLILGTSCMLRNGSTNLLYEDCVIEIDPMQNNMILTLQIFLWQFRPLHARARMEVEERKTATVCARPFVISHYSSDNLISARPRTRPSASWWATRALVFNGGNPLI